MSKLKIVVKLGIYVRVKKWEGTYSKKEVKDSTGSLHPALLIRMEVYCVINILDT